MVFRTGRIMAFKSPRKIPAIRYSFIPPFITKPGINKKAKYKANEFPNILIVKPIILVKTNIALIRYKFNFR